MKSQPLDIYDEFPYMMRIYLRNNGWHFSKKACDWAVKLMKKKSSSTGRMEYIEPMSRDDVDALLKQCGIILDNNVGYDYVFVANMCKADYLHSSIPDEQHLALYVKDTIDDVDGAEGVTFRRWYATMVAIGIPIDWEEIL